MKNLLYLLTSLIINAEPTINAQIIHSESQQDQIQHPINLSQLLLENIDIVKADVIIEQVLNGNDSGAKILDIKNINNVSQCIENDHVSDQKKVETDSDNDTSYRPSLASYNSGDESADTSTEESLDLN